MNQQLRCLLSRFLLVEPWFIFRLGIPPSGSLIPLVRVDRRRSILPALYRILAFLFPSRFYSPQTAGTLSDNFHSPDKVDR